MIIGFNGHAGAGKDTAAEILIRVYNFRRVAFADKLKIACKTVFSFTDSQLFGADKDVIDRYWGMSPREILQRVGTECFRIGFDSDVWVKAALRDIEPGRDYVITDVRFPNEAEAIKDRGGRVIRINRDNARGAGMVHASENALSGWEFDSTINNNGTIEDLNQAVIHAVFSPYAGNTTYNTIRKGA
jgi:hypothetical protein